MTDVLRVGDINLDDLKELLAHYQLNISVIDDGEPIPGSFWGDEEAGLIDNNLYLRRDTPIHSVLHESSHFICVDDSRRAQLNTNAGADCDEENAVCYLQILLSDYLPSIDRERMFGDMDSWGYSFRLGSTNAWFETDAEDAKSWLFRRRLIDQNSQVRLSALNH